MSKKTLRIVYMGTPEFSVPALDALHAAGHEIVAVYSQPPRPSGRGHKLQSSPVHRRAEELGLAVKTPKSLKSKEAQEEFAALNADVAVVAAYGLILPKTVLDAPVHGCLNIHASLLPRWRGAAPIQYAILSGDKSTGISIMQMNEGLDTGPVISMKKVSITTDTTCPTLHDQLSTLGAKMIADVIDDIAAGKKIESKAQDDSKSTYAKMLKREDGMVDWAKSAAEIERQIRALTPWPGVWCTVNGARLKIHDASIIEDSGEPGTIIDRDFTIACGKKALRLNFVQPADKKPMPGAAFMNGARLKIGETLQ